MDILAQTVLPVHVGSGPWRRLSACRAGTPVGARKRSAPKDFHARGLQSSADKSVSAAGTSACATRPHD